MVLLASDITSTRLAVKFAIYKTPRGSSSARSEAWPPIDTTVPKVALQPTVARDAAKVIFHQYDLLNITVNSKRQISNLPPNDFKRGAGTGNTAPRFITKRLFGALLAAQNDQPKKQDCEHRANDANHRAIHRFSPF